MMSKLERTTKRKESEVTVEASSEKQGTADEVQPPEFQPRDDGPSLASAFDPNEVLNLESQYDPLPGGLLQDSEDEAVRGAPAMVRMVSTVAPSSALPVCPTAATGTVMPMTDWMFVEPDRILSLEEMVELLTSNPELDINSYGQFLARDHKLDAASVEGVKSALERCRRHLKHYAETLLLDSSESRISGATDPNSEVIVRLLKQTGRAST